MAGTLLQIASSWNFIDSNIQPLGRGPAFLSASEFLLFTFKGDLLLKSDPANLGGAVAGAVGYLVGKAMSAKSSPVVPKDLRFVDAIDLPEEIRRTNDWPGTKVNEKQVLIVPFVGVNSARMPWWGSLTLTLNDVAINIPVYTFGRKRIRQHLDANGFTAFSSNQVNA